MVPTAEIPEALRETTIEELRRHAPFSAMARAHLGELVAKLSLAYFPAGRQILSPEHGVPEHLFIVRRGLVESLVPESAAANTAPVITLSAGEAFPIGALIAAHPPVNLFRAAQDSFCFLLPRETFARMLEISTEFRDFCTRRLAHLLERSQERLVAEYANAAAASRSLAQPLGEIATRTPVCCAPATSLRQAAALMHEGQVGSIVVVDAAGRALGIFTLRDLLDRVVAQGADLEAPIERFMTRDPVALDVDQAAVDAAVAMARHGFHHILVTRDGRLRGVVSERDLFALQRVQVTRIADAVRAAADLDALVPIAADVRALAHSLLAQGASSEHVSRIITELNDRLSTRLIEQEMDCADVRGIELCWLALGSEGRGEQTFATDQDNAIVFADPVTGTAEESRARLLPVASRINQGLDRLGFPLCKGGIMAGNPRCCLSFSEWRGRFAHWIDQGDPQALLDSAIFFDFRPLWGEATLAQRLRDWLAPVARANSRFQRQLAQQALANAPPLGALGDFKLSDRADRSGVLDLKLQGTALFVDAARVAALAAGAQASATAARLRQAAERLRLDSRECDAWLEAFWFLQLLRLKHQHARLQAGLPADNLLDPAALNELDRRILKECFLQARRLQAWLRFEYQL
jgi:CBS domain-containing protein